MASRESLLKVFGDDTVLLSNDSIPEELRRQPTGQTLTHTGLPENLLDAISSVPGLKEGVETYAEHYVGVEVEFDERIDAMYRIGFAGTGDILVEADTGDVHFVDHQERIVWRINSSVDKYVEVLCLLETERKRFDFLDEDDVAVQRKTLANQLRDADASAWPTGSTFWRWIIEQISADEYRVF
ncbi:SUKH-4 family immunity protein [Streptomyces sp. NPDC014735]|uniref:SUKH-4 family immunity protein n=1 Tax=Streptomyces sp. NPDC014735 TaxID=3364887 RepID=UPI0036FBE019